MSPTTVLVLCFLCIFSSAAASAAGDGELTAYEILQRYDFPVGLLPKGVTGYDLDPATGQFSAYLNGTCSFSLEGSYQLKYRPTIRGLIAKDRITKLNGISVKVLFLWLNIVEVVRSGDELDFSVGIASANFPIDNFEECPQCGCGLNCVNGQSMLGHCLKGASLLSVTITPIPWNLPGGFNLASPFKRQEMNY